MLAKLKNFFRTTGEDLAVAIDPWKNSGDFYVGGFRRQLDEIAAALSPRIPGLRTRFNAILKCAEFYSGKEVIARVAVHGSECAPYRIIVAPETLPEAAKQLFTAGLPYVEFAPAIP